MLEKVTCLALQIFDRICIEICIEFASKMRKVILNKNEKFYSGIYLALTFPQLRMMKLKYLYQIGH